MKSRGFAQDDAGNYQAGDFVSGDGWNLGVSSGFQSSFRNDELLLRNISSFPAMPCPKCHQFNTNALLSSARACYVSGPRTLQSLHRSDAFCRGAAPLVFTMRDPMVPMLFGDQAGIMFGQTISVCLQNKCEKFEKEFGVEKRSAFYPKLSIHPWEWAGNFR